MSTHASLPAPAGAEAISQAQVQALRRVALAVARPAGPDLFADLVRELAASLQAAMVFVAVYADDSRSMMRTLAVCLHGQMLPNFSCPLQGSPFAAVAGRSCQFIESGLLTQLARDSLFASEGMDSSAAFALNDSAGESLGLLVAMDPEPIAEGDAGHAEAMLEIVAGRASAEIERGRTDEALRAVALAVSASRSGTVFEELVRLLATILHVEVAFIARYGAAQPDSLRVLAMYNDGEIVQDVTYKLAGTPCQTVLGQRFQAYPSCLQQLFPNDPDIALHQTESYAGHPLVALDGSPLGLVSVASRRPLMQVDRVEAMLKIFAVRAAAEVERLGASEALQRSEASYRAIFETSEDAIFIHDWDTGAVLDVNAKACEIYGYTHDELRRSSAADTSSGMFPYTAEEAMRHLQMAKQGSYPPFEWQRRNKDGTLHWDEVRLKPAMIDGRPHILAFTREITAQKQALEDLRQREEQYRAIFESSLDGLFLWDENLRVADVNPAGLALYGIPRREDAIGRTFPRKLPDAYVRERLGLVRRALEGETTHIETVVLRPDGTTFDADLRVMPFAHRGRPHALTVVRDISERRRRERELQRSEARLRATVEAAFDCVVSMDSEGRIVEFNAAAERVFGYRREDVLGRMLADVLMPKRHRAAHIRALETFSAHDAPTGGRLVEATALCADGSELPVEVAISVAAVPEGKIFVGHLRDITERRRADQALRDSEEQYRAIFNASADALVLRAADFSIVDVNATYEAMSGYSRAEVLGVNRVLANPPAVVPTILALHKKAVAGEAIGLDTELIRRDGRRYDLELRGVPILHRGQPHVLYIGRDITQAKRAEHALRASEEQYRAIFNASADALVLRDGNFRAVEVNPAYTTMSGFTREEVMSSDHVLTQADPAVRARHRAQHELAVAGQELRFEITATRKDGSTLQCEVRGTPMTYRGRPHVLYATRDITDRHAAEQRRSELERQLRQAQKMEAIGQLTGGIAHDFNNILTSVLGYIAMAQERPKPCEDPVLARQLEQARLAAERARDHVAQLLAFSRPRRGERRLLAAGPVAQQALQLLRPNLPSSIAVACPEVVDGCEGAVPPVVADPVQLEQVLFNLCINARDAIHGHGTIRVRIGYSAASGHCASCSAPLEGTRWVWVEVADDGRGMARDVMERMFEPFFTTKEVGRGTGMGLAMVHGIVHDHGGHIEVISTPGEGSAFRVLLPAAAQETEQADDVVAPAPAAAPAVAPLHGRVLLVEDEAIVSDYMVSLMTGWGLEVVLEHDPRAAAQRLASSDEDFDLLLTDQTMPGMTGLALSKQATRYRPALPVLVYTGNASEIGQRELADCGASALLRKPVDGATLRHLLSELIGPRVPASP
ncbi:PAS domain-containing hybrid sensor histidine kinase/response regulator [Caenimonas soli]|uniref:PAS domain-containing hybrid sensor histidine kinase/response regulator n=1 Tax=Caenimonas soli TaxID=2735555 RepID=UPI00155737E2|nr:PAS domain S-box protein [Caenimonas soli]NPC56326.1 PAS domain S-box protein [Caenimonas soli]